MNDRPPRTAQAALSSGPDIWSEGNGDLVRVVAGVSQTFGVIGCSLHPILGPETLPVGGGCRPVTAGRPSRKKGSSLNDGLLSASGSAESTPAMESESYLE